MKYEINTVRLFCGFTIMLLSIVYCIITANVFGTPNEIETEAEAIVGGIATLIACIGFSTIGMSFRLNPVVRGATESRTSPPRCSTSQSDLKK